MARRARVLSGAAYLAEALGHVEHAAEVVGDGVEQPKGLAVVASCVGGQQLIHRRSNALTGILAWEGVRHGRSRRGKRHGRR